MSDLLVQPQAVFSQQSVLVAGQERTERQECGHTQERVQRQVRLGVRQSSVFNVSGNIRQTASCRDCGRERFVRELGHTQVQ